MVTLLFVSALFGTLVILDPMKAAEMEPPNATDVPAMVTLLFTNALLGTLLIAGPI